MNYNFCLGCQKKINNDKEYCQRCYKIKHYNYFDNQINLDEKKIIKENINGVYKIAIIDLFNPEDNFLNFINKDEEYLIVANKIDLLPKSLNKNDLINNLQKIYKNKNILIISSKKNNNIDELYNFINNLKYKKIAFVGNVSVGKTSILNNLISVSKNQKYDNFTTSIFPSTTLNKISVKINQKEIIDLPGIVNNFSLLNIKPNQVKNFYPKKEIKIVNYQVYSRQSFFINDYLIINLKDKLSIFFRFSSLIKIHRTSTKNKDRNLKNLNKKIIKSIEIKNIKKDEMIFINGLGSVVFNKKIEKINIDLLEDIKIEKKKRIF